ncbi:hypothetical protein K443DRAFT_295704 [Laccaria amethystina LaAM-08-1]|uniref:Uncharacterized protein n=1 Tax=Laccaria amethystina LaAM-08-1 TaxID=1095629 RepID=A0A0C9WKB1_9AGAR|nr:hypothetical protein K443DRAFT_295704 [Laccaria amethystina LaAM-08-1]
MENSFGNPQVFSRGTPPCLVEVPLIIPSPPANHRTLSAADVVPSGSPSTSHTPSMAYPSPLWPPPHLPLHTPQTAHFGPSEVSVSSATPSTTLYAPNTHSPTSTTVSPLPERKCGRPKGSVKVKPVTYGPCRKLGWPPLPPNSSVRYRSDDAALELARLQAKRQGRFPHFYDLSEEDMYW